MSKKKVTRAYRTLRDEPQRRSRPTPEEYGLDGRIPAKVLDEPDYAAFMRGANRGKIDPVEALLFAAAQSKRTHGGCDDYNNWIRSARGRLAGQDERNAIAFLRYEIGVPLPASDYEEMLTIVREVVRYFRKRAAA